MCASGNNVLLQSKPRLRWPKSTLNNKIENKPNLTSTSTANRKMPDTHAEI